MSDGVDISKELFDNMTAEERLHIRYLCELSREGITVLEKMRLGIKYRIAKRKLKKMIKESDFETESETQDAELPTDKS